MVQIDSANSSQQHSINQSITNRIIAIHEASAINQTTYKTTHQTIHAYYLSNVDAVNLPLL
jgi:hypothetical protein